MAGSAECSRARLRLWRRSRLCNALRPHHFCFQPYWTVSLAGAINSLGRRGSSVCIYSWVGWKISWPLDRQSKAEERLPAIAERDRESVPVGTADPRENHSCQYAQSGSTAGRSNVSPGPTSCLRPALPGPMMDPVNAVSGPTRDTAPASNGPMRDTARATAGLTKATTRVVIGGLARGFAMRWSGFRMWYARVGSGCPTWFARAGTGCRTSSARFGIGWRNGFARLGLSSSRSYARSGVGSRSWCVSFGETWFAPSPALRGRR